MRRWADAPHEHPAWPDEATEARVWPEDPVWPDDAVVLVVGVVVVGVTAALAAVEVGTVNAGAPEALTEVEPPPPQPAIAAATTSDQAPSVSSLFRRVRCPSTPRASAPEGFHPPAAVRAVVQVLLTQLIAPVAESEVLNRPRELRAGRRQRQQLGHDL